MLKCCAPSPCVPADTTLAAGRGKKSHQALPNTMNYQEPKTGYAEQPAPLHSLAALGTTV